MQPRPESCTQYIQHLVLKCAQRLRARNSGGWSECPWPHWAEGNRKGDVRLRSHAFSSTHLPFLPKLASRVKQCAEERHSRKPLESVSPCAAELVALVLLEP